jgi:hypothetical protein
MTKKYLRARRVTNDDNTKTFIYGLCDEKKYFNYFFTKPLTINEIEDDFDINYRERC